MASAQSPKSPAPAQNQSGGEASGAPSLENAAINLDVFRSYGRRELVDVLDSVRGAKALVLDPKLSGPLGLVVEVGLLREHSVEKIYHLLPGRLDTECTNVIYLVRPKVEYMKYIAEHIHINAKAGKYKHYSVFFVPRSTMIAERALEEEGVYGDVTVGQYNLDLIPFEDDVLSLELDNGYRECFLEGNRTCLFYVARALMKMQAIFGIIPEIKGVGEAAKLVKDMLLRMRKEIGADEPVVLPEIDTLILIDRAVDMITPMPTQLTYEGLVDEVFGITNSHVDLDAEMVAPDNKDASSSDAQPDPNKKVKHPLNSNDSLYGMIRDLNFSALGPVLNEKAKEIDKYYQRRHAVQSITEIRDFMRSLGSIKQEHYCLKVHTNVAERIASITKTPDFHRRLAAEQSMLMDGDENLALQYIEETINKSGPLLKVLRLMILYSQTHNGLPQKLFDFYRKEIVQTYGFEYTFTLNNLLKLGLIKPQQGRAIPYELVRKKLNLFNGSVNEKQPNDLSYVYSGYAPLTSRIVQFAENPGWQSVQDALSTLGPVFEIKQKLPAGVAADVEKKAKASQQQGLERSKVTLVFFIGGVTFTEISALRYLHKHEEGKRDFIIATTKLINGDSILNSIIDQVDNSLSHQPPSSEK